MALSLNETRSESDYVEFMPKQKYSEHFENIFERGHTGTVRQCY